MFTYRLMGDGIWAVFCGTSFVASCSNEDEAFELCKKLANRETDGM